MLFAQGVELLIYGMGTVVLFLTLLVFATRGMSAVIERWFLEAAADLEETGDASPASAAPSPQILAAIAVAVHRYRRDRRHR